MSLPRLSHLFPSRAETRITPAFVQHLELKGWEAHIDLPDRSWFPERTLPSSTDDAVDDEQTAYETELKNLPGDHRALILFCSHVGGHKFAGNVIVRHTVIISSSERADDLYRYTCPAARACGMVVSRRTTSSPSSRTPSLAVGCCFPSSEVA